MQIVQINNQEIITEKLVVTFLMTSVFFSSIYI